MASRISLPNLVLAGGRQLNATSSLLPVVVGCLAVDVTPRFERGGGVQGGQRGRGLPNTNIGKMMAFKGRG